MLALNFGRLINVMELRELCARLEMSEGLQEVNQVSRGVKKGLFLSNCVSVKRWVRVQEGAAVSSVLCSAGAQVGALC